MSKTQDLKAITIRIEPEAYENVVEIAGEERRSLNRQFSVIVDEWLRFKQQCNLGQPTHRQPAP